MILPAAPFGAAVRVLRTAAGRRALQLALLVGGLFVLGFLCGEQAHAADRTPAAATATATATDTASAPRPPAGHLPRRPAGRQAAPAGTPRAVRSLREGPVAPVARVVRTVAERVVAPVRQVATTASGPVGEARGTAPSLPLPDVTRLPDLPGSPPAHRDKPAPGSRSDAGHAARTPAGQRQAGTGTGTAVTGPAPVTAYGPETHPAPWQPAHDVAHHAAPSAEAGSGLPAPTGGPGGAPGRQAAVDGTAFPHGDAPAVTLADRAPLRLAPGARARVDAPGTRERHRDIPVFPG
ncbi:hypothetical protein GCM10010503_02290 [Streptomyces lucensis JCM 4490]|uniref:Uncharacterized protein n=1 Tax=Streptomyces lucensis JCM 4490 TaxID=1306176 RepID=A0A918MKC8_9ACTN|nr:hypothetical protein [Streptomyces lucensis]GGW30298.1 hypothetical protein GCM10010503_02290 [Streptomyces lucensis JCM 4490]